MISIKYGTCESFQSHYIFKVYLFHDNAWLTCAYTIIIILVFVISVLDQRMQNAENARFSEIGQILTINSVHNDFQIESNLA